MPSRRARSPTKEVAAIHKRNLSEAQSPSIKYGEKRRSLEGADGVFSERGWSEVLHMPKLKSTLSRSLSDPVRKAVPPRSIHRRYISLTTLDTVSSKKSPDSLVDKHSGDRGVYDFELNKNTEHMVPRYGVCKHASGLAVDQQAAVWETRIDGENLLSGLKSSNKIDIAVRTHLEGFSEDNANTSLSAPEVSSSSSSSVVGLEDFNTSRSGWNTNSTESVKMRKHKSPVQIERAMERQRLARRAKRAAKPYHSSEDHTALDHNKLSENNKELQEARLQFEKETDDNLRVLSEFLRASRAQKVDGMQHQRLFDTFLDLFYEPDHGAVSAMKTFNTGSNERIQTVNQSGWPVHEHDEITFKQFRDIASRHA